MIRSDLCDFTDGYVVVIEKITIYKTENENRNIDTHNRKLNLKNCAPCASYKLTMLSEMMLLISISIYVIVSFN